MTSEAVIRATGWSLLGAQETQRLCKRLDADREPTQRIKHVPGTRLTHAENFGEYVREVHAVFTALHDAMKPTRTWHALQWRSTEHSEANDAEYSRVDDLQVKAFAFDPLIFTCPWVDNSLSHPWQPWGWRVSPLSADLDETQCFFDEASDRLVIGHVESIELFGLTVRLPASLAQFTTHPNP